ncbi:MAG: hypothetical protein Q9222_001833 [Ikaeria aurantiellina]
MVKPLAFKGDKKVKKRKATTVNDESHVEKEKGEKASGAQEDDSWVTADTVGDIGGPTLVILPSAPPTCLACDAAGKVFTSSLENMIEGDPATAEPHDMRQVWIASKIAGTDEISLKGHHGRYGKMTEQPWLRLLGLNSPNTDTWEETFLCIPSPDTPGTFGIQTQREKFISVTDDGKDVRGDSESISFNTTLRIRMQARYKPKLRASKESKAKEKISRKELEEAVGRRLEDDEVRKLKKARIQGDYHETLLDVRVKGKHDKYS